MTRRQTLQACVLLVVALAALAAPVPSLAGEPTSGQLVFAGSEPNLPVTRLLAQAFRQVHPEITIEIPVSMGSSGGIRATAEGAITVGLISRPLRDREKGLGLTVIPYARTGLVIAAHPTVADNDITSEDFVQIIRGTKSRWRDGREIIVLTLQPGDSLIQELEAKVPNFKPAYAESHQAKRWTVLYKDEEMDQTIARTPHAIGFSNYGSITAERLPIKALKLDGVAPTPENLLSGRYPLVLTLAFVFQKDKLPPGARAFLEFVRSRNGEKILRANGYLPAE